MNAITLPKNPPSATMGIKTSSSPIRSSRPRSLASASRRLSSSTSASSCVVSLPSTTPCFAAFMAIHCSSVFDHPRIHSASAFPTGPVRTTVVPMTSARPIIATAGTHIPMRRFPPLGELTDLVPHRQHLAQVLARERRFHPRHVLRRPGGHHGAAGPTPLGTATDPPVSRLHDVQVVLDHHDRVPLVHQPVQDLEQQAHVFEVDRKSVV